MKRYFKKLIFCRDMQSLQNIREEQGSLYLVETRDQLQTLKRQNIPVIAWLHEGNRDQDLTGAFYAVEEPQSMELDFWEKVYRREKKIPWEILETQRCLVREMVPEDSTVFAQIYGDEEICRYMKDFHGSAENEAVYIREYQSHYRFFEYGIWSIVLKETGEVIGKAGFSESDTEISEQERNISVDSLPQFGYMIGRAWQKQGLAYEVCSAILQYAREELEFEAVGLAVEKENVASIRLADRLGFNTVKSSCQIIWKVLHLTY